MTSDWRILVILQDQFSLIIIAVSHQFVIAIWIHQGQVNKAVSAGLLDVSGTSLNQQNNTFHEHAPLFLSEILS